MGYRLIAFDFDGTLADSLPWLGRQFDELADRFQFARLERGALEELRRLDTRQLLARQRVPLWKLPAIARELRARMQRDAGGIELFGGIGEALRALAQGGKTLALATSNSQANALRILGPEHAAHFSHLACGSALLGKQRALRVLLRASGVAPGEAILVGDELRDADAAARAGIAFGAVAWGYTPLETLAARGAREVFHSTAELARKLL